MGPPLNTHTHTQWLCLAICSLEVLSLYTCHLKLQQKTDAGVVTEERTLLQS